MPFVVLMLEFGKKLKKETITYQKSSMIGFNPWAHGPFDYSFFSILLDNLKRFRIYKRNKERKRRKYL